ncbi:MAG: shikimate kinase, partial [Candidatus Marinamargulisbacteria bacterium]
GKSSIGRKIAQFCGFKFVDTDRLIGQSIESPLKDYINEHGESAFLRIEEETILAFEKFEGTIIATGGSVVYSEKAMAHLAKYSRVLLLADAPDNILKRISKTIMTRGIVGLHEQSFQTFYASRNPLYEANAEFTVVLPNPFHQEKIAKLCMEKLGLVQK